MSLWKKIKCQDDVELSEDGKTLEVLYDSDNQGNYYIEIPIEFVKLAFEKQDQNGNDQKG